MKICVNAGHCLTGAGTGAIYNGLKESEITRAVATELIVQLRRRGHTVINSTVNKAVSQSAYLREVCNIANGSKADLFISLHCNMSSSHKGYGSEVWTWNGTDYKEAVGILHELNKLGFYNRGIKKGNDLYVVKYTTMPAILVEMFFMDDLHDRALYEKHGAKKIAQAILKGIV